jgi:uncharacterized protein YcbK (DUF882 family)
LKKLGWGAAAAGLFVAGLHMLPTAGAGGETRTMTLYGVNTKERLTTTYMVNGKHVASELAKINHLLRDWRRDAVTKIDPKTIDLMWELHADLGSRAPIHIISGYRSAQTNAMLKSIGRNVAKRSMHIQGKAIDLYFPDVPTERVRNSALVREVGGVGYYPRSGASGFIHIDSGRVRHWPGISQDQIARIRRDYVKTVGARLGRTPAVMVASAETPAEAEEGYPTPTPRPRPIEVLMMAAAQVTIEPAAAPVPRRNFSGIPSPVRDKLATDLARDLQTDLVVAQVVEGPQSNTNAKSGLVTVLRDGIAAGLPAVQPVGASVAAGAQDLLSWPAQLFASVEGLFGRDDSRQNLGWGTGSASVEEAKVPFPPITEEEEAELEVIIAALRTRASYDAQIEQSLSTAKGDRLIINRARKGDLVLAVPPPRYRIDSAAKPAEPAEPAEPVSQAAVQTFEKLLHSTDQAE